MRQDTGSKQPPVDQKYLANFPDGADGANVKFFFCTPAGEIVHFVQGYYKPESFRSEVAFAQKALRAVARDRNGRQPRVIALHQTRLASLRREAASPPQNGSTRARRLRAGLLQVLIANHETACNRLLQDPQPFMVNESLGFA